MTQINFAENSNKPFKNLKKVYNLHYCKDIAEGHVINLDKISNIKYTDSSKKRLLKLLKFMRAQSADEREEIAKGDEKLMDFNMWLDAYTNSDLVKNGMNDVEWNQKIAYSRYKDETAINMLKEGMSLDIISKVTGLSLNDISKLQEEIDNKN